MNRTNNKKGKWYTPNEDKQRHFKHLCLQLVEYIILLEREGDPDCCDINQAHKLINHLYRPSECVEMQKNKEEKDKNE